MATSLKHRLSRLEQTMRSHRPGDIATAILGARRRCQGLSSEARATEQREAAEEALRMLQEGAVSGPLHRAVLQARARMLPQADKLADQR